METQESFIDCPTCGHAFEPAAEALQRCPACGEQFFIQLSSDESEEDREAREKIERRMEADKERLDTRKIRVVQLERRGLYRSRAWMLVIAFALLGMAGQLIWLALRSPSEVGRLVAYFVVAAILVIFSLRFVRRARRYQQEADAMHQSDPATPPDFSSLRNGSQFADQLEEMSEEK